MSEIHQIAALLEPRLRSVASIPSNRRRATGISLIGGGMGVVSFDYTSLEDFKRKRQNFTACGQAA